MTVFVQGDEKTVTKFIESIKSPPPPTLVRSVEKRGKTRPKLKHFEIRVGRLEDELLEGFGAMQIIFNDYRIEFRDFRQDSSKEWTGSLRVTRVLEMLVEGSKRNRELLEIVSRDSRETREMLVETMKMLKEVVSRVA